MKVLVCPHHMGVGGSQLTAIELAGAVREHGHEAVVYAPPGVLVDHVRALGLEYVQAPETGTGLSREWTAGLVRAVKEDGVDLVHAYEWAPCVEATFGVGWRQRVPVLMSVMSMDVPEFLPRHLPLVVGTEALAERERDRGRQVHLLEPPIRLPSGDALETRTARRTWEIGPEELVISTATMLTTDLEKLQGVLALVATVDKLAGKYPLRLLIAGDGEGFEQVCLRAKRVNERHERTVVEAVGLRTDPSDVYAAADVVVGMGSSAIRGMAFGKPLVVHGEGGFWRLLDPGTADGFLHNGWFGEDGAGVRDLERALTHLFDRPRLREDLGRYGRQLARGRYSLDRAGQALSGIYREVAATHPTPARTMASLARSAVQVAKFRASIRLSNPVRQQRWSHAGVAL